ncbi:hypothetical protein QN277_024673 [Acacia crassicarpa]|uniref:Uncharacterized protein n=1 Tax=Acacia crassicarpa TaxID=499986 RepID=A0AAE1MPB7_9FABA|nr:hypothetical protein QN277_024673 [Acacia crassicarpa]
MHFKALFGHPFTLIQGTLEAQGSTIRNVPREFCPSIRRGSVVWVDSGREVFISLVNPNKWKKEYAVICWLCSI